MATLLPAYLSLDNPLIPAGIFGLAITSGIIALWHLYRRLQTEKHEVHRLQAQLDRANHLYQGLYAICRNPKAIHSVATVVVDVAAYNNAYFFRCAICSQVTLTRDPFDSQPCHRCGGEVRIPVWDHILERLANWGTELGTPIIIAALSKKETIRMARGG